MLMTNTLLLGMEVQSRPKYRFFILFSSIFFLAFTLYFQPAPIVNKANITSLGTAAGESRLLPCHRQPKPCTWLWNRHGQAAEESARSMAGSPRH